MRSESCDKLPLVYSCSGCSNIAQLANRVAVELDRDGVAEMSCIAGVGGGVPSLVRRAKSGRDILSLDGCALNCVKRCLALHDIKPTFEFQLTDFGIVKRAHVEYEESDVERVRDHVLATVRGV